MADHQQFWEWREWRERKSASATLEEILSHDDWDWVELSSGNPNVTWEIVKARPWLPWNYYSMSYRDDITWDIAAEHSDLDWDFAYLAEKYHVPWSRIEASILEPKVAKSLSGSSIVCWQHVEQLPEAQWDYLLLSANENIDWDIVKANLDKPWCFDRLSLNPNIRWSIVKAHPELPWRLDILKINKMDAYNWSEFTVMNRCQRRCQRIKDELLAVVFDPDRVDRLGFAWLAQVG